MPFVHEFGISHTSNIREKKTGNEVYNRGEERQRESIPESFLVLSYECSIKSFIFLLCIKE